MCIKSSIDNKGPAVPKPYIDGVKSGHVGLCNDEGKSGWRESSTSKMLPILLTPYAKIEKSRHASACRGSDKPTCVKSRIDGISSRRTTP